MPRARKATAETPAQASPPFDFEGAMAELEAVVGRLEQGDVPLEDALKTFERGVALTRACQQALATAEQKVELLLARPDGEHEAVPFHDAPEKEDPA